MLRSQSYSPEAVPNAIGPALERNCLARGGAASSCRVVAQRAGGVGNGYGVTKVLDNAWQGAKDYSSWDQTAGVIVGGCSSGAALGLVAGAVISTPIGGALGPPGAGLGCGVGVLGGLAALLGNATNGAVRCIVKDCSVKAQGDNLSKNADATGPGAGGSSTQSLPGNMDGIQLGQGGDPPSDQVRADVDKAFAKFGYNNFFLFRKGAYGYWYKGFIVKYRPEMADAYGAIRVDDRFQIEAGMNFCSGYYRPNTCLPDKPVYRLFSGTSTGDILLSGDPYYSAGATMPAEPKLTIASVLNQPLFTLPYSGVIKPEALPREIAPSILADLANAAYKMMSEAGTLPPDTPLYDPSTPVTPTDIEQARQITGSNPVRLGDVIAGPTLRPGQESIPGGTLGGLTKPPQDVNIIGGGTINTGEGTSGDGGNGSSDKDDDVEWDGGGDAEPGDMYQPWRDWMEGPFRQYLHPGNIIPPSINGCPSIDFDFTDFMRNRTGLAPNPKAYTQYCDFILKPLKPLGGKSLREILIPIFHMLATWAGFKILMTGRVRG